MSIATDIPAADPANSNGRLYPWFVVLFLMLLLTSSFIDRTILSLLVKPIRQDLHLTDTEFSYLAGLAFVLLYTTTGIPLGWLADRWSRRWLIAGGVAVWSVMTASCGLAGSFWRLFASRVGVGVGEATLSPCSYALISELFPPERRARPLSVFTLGIPIGSGLALMIGGSVIQAISAVGPIDLPFVGFTRPWQSVFLIVGLPGILLALLAVLIVRETPHRLAKTAADQPSFGAVLGFIWQNLSVYATLALSLGCFAIYGYGGNAWIPTYLQRVHGFSAAQSGLFFGGSVLFFGVLGSIAAGWFTDRHEPKGTFERIYRDGHGLRLRDGCHRVARHRYCRALAVTHPGIALGLLLPDLGRGECRNAADRNPVRMRGQVSATYLFFTNMIGLGLGPTSIAASTDYIFHRDTAVGWSISLVGTISMVLAWGIFRLGRGAMARQLEAVDADGAA